MADVLGRGTDQRFFGYTLDLYRVVRDQAVTALDQLDSGLGLADAAVTDQQDTFAVHLDQYAVAGDALRQFHMEERNDRRMDVGSIVRRRQDRHLILARKLPHRGQRLDIAGDDHRGRTLAEDRLELGYLGSVTLRFQKRHLCLSERDQIAIVIVFQVTDKLESRTVDVGDCDKHFLGVNRHVAAGQTDLVDQAL